MAGCVIGAPPALQGLTLSLASARWLVSTGTMTAVSTQHSLLTNASWLLHSLNSVIIMSRQSCSLERTHTEQHVRPR
jgi:hypothetical protein